MGGPGGPDADFFAEDDLRSL